MSQELIAKANGYCRKENIPDFKIGDTVDVSVRIVEGEKERIQVYTGTVIRRKGSGISETFTVRRIVSNQGVERIFPLHSPRVAGVKVQRSGRVRRAKLHYLRDRIGKATRLKEVRTMKKPLAKAKAKPQEAPAQAESPAETGQE